MKRPHLLRVSGPASAYAELASAVAATGWRLGWLDLEAPAELAGRLAEAAELPLLRAVAASPERTVAVKPRQGPPVLDDLLREHFLGCRLVLVVGGAAELPALEPAGESGWRLSVAGSQRTLSTRELIDALSRPHPFPSR